jgi:hypothetical protein
MNTFMLILLALGASFVFAIAIAVGSFISAGMRNEGLRGGAKSGPKTRDALPASGEPVNSPQDSI